MFRNKQSGKTAIFAVGAIIVIAAAVIGMNFAGNSDGTTTTIETSDSHSGEAHSNSEHQWTGKPEIKSERMMKIRTDNGEEIEFNLDDPEELEKALANLPEKEREAIRNLVSPEGGLHEFTTADGKKMRFRTNTENVNGDPAEMMAEVNLDHDAIMRDAKASRDAIDQLVAQGVPEAEAQRIVTNALSDSIKKQLDNPNAQVFTQISGGENGESGPSMIMIGIEDEIGGTSDEEAIVTNNVEGSE